MKFIDYITWIPELKNFEVEIMLSSWENIVVPNITWKQASLRLLQAHLWNDAETSQKFRLENFCEHYEDWKKDPEWNHTTINFLHRYNQEWWIIRRNK